MGKVLCKNNYNYNNFIVTDFVRLEEFEKLQKEVQKLKKQNKKKRWKNYGNKK